MGTQDGLCRFDGYEFVVYRRQHRVKNTLSSNFISSLAEDNEGNIWVGTQNRGLNRLNTRTGSISVFENDSTNPKSMSNNVIWTLMRDAKGRIWAGTSQGVNIFVPQSGTFTRIIHNPQDSTSLNHNQVRAFAEAKDGTVWIGTQNGLNCYNPQTRSITRFSLPLSDEMPTNNFITALFLDANGILWIGTDAGVLNRFDTKKHVFTTFRCNHGENLADNYVRAIKQDAQERLWIGTNTGGLLCFHPQTSTMTACKREAHTIKSLPENTVISLLVEPSGTLWVGTNNGGVCRTLPYPQRFTSIGEQRAVALHPASEALQSTIIRALREDRNGNLWVGTRGGGLYWFSPREMRIERIALPFKKLQPSSNALPQSSNQASNQATSQPTERVWSILQTRAGTLWIGTDNGVYVLDATTKRVQWTFNNTPNDSTSLSSNLVRSLLEDADGNIWIGTRNEGVNRYNPQTRTNTIFKHNPTNPNSLPANNVWSLLQDRSGTIWLGTVAGGLARFDAARSVFTSFRTNTEDSSSIINDIVWSLAEDRTGTLWAGTNGGLARFDAATQTFSNFTRAHGLPNDVMYGVVEGSDGYLWLSTNGGLSKFHPHTGEVRNYEVSSGLQGNEFNGNACCRGASGKLYFGGSQGWTMFYPDSIRDKHFQPPLAITNLRRTTSKGAQEETLFSSEEITVLPNTYALSLDIAAFDFTAPEKIRYRYMLRGFDENWSITDAQHRRITYTNLPAGEYTLIAQATNSDGIWSKHSQQVRIIVIPPWWQTWWFRLSMILVCGMSIAGGVQWRLYAAKRDNQKLTALVKERTNALAEANQEMEIVNQTLHEQNQELKALNAEKNEFLGIVSHDLKNPLSAVRGMAEILAESDSADASVLLKAIVNTSDRMLDLVKNLLDVNRMETQGIQLFCVELPAVAALEMKVEEYSGAASEKNIQFHLDYSDASTTAFADEQAFMQVLDNLLSNAVKYSPHGKNIWVSCEAQAKTTQVRIKDEGQGMTEDDLKQLFGKFAKLSARPTDGEHSTGLGLSIVKKLVESMNGKIWCESEYGKGATFILELPHNAPHNTPLTLQA